MGYRSAWMARQEDGSLVVLHSPEYASLKDAIRDRDEAARLVYVTDAWVETATWARIPDGVAESGRLA